MDGSLVIISIVDIIMFLINDTTSRIFGILRVNIFFHLKTFFLLNCFAGVSVVKIFETFEGDQ